MKSLTPAGFDPRAWWTWKRGFHAAVFAVILAFYASSLFIKISLPNMDNDAGLYITDGKVIWQTHKTQRSNIYSYTMPDYPVYDHHWLSSVVFYLVSEAAGFGGLTALKGFILLSAFSVLFLAALKKADFWLVALFSMPVIQILSGRNRIRPEMFSYLFIALFLYLLFDLEKHPERKRIFWLVPLQLLWVNFHLFFFLGIALVGGFLFEKIVLNWRYFWRDPAVKKLFLILPMLIAVVFINPNGIEGALAPLKTHSYENFTVSENQPFFDFNASVLTWDIFSSPFVPMIAVFIFSFIFGFRKKPIFFLLAGLGSAGIALTQVRLITLFALMFLPAVSSNFNDAFLTAKEWLRQKRPRTTKIASYALIFAVVAMFPYKAYRAYANAVAQGYPTNLGVGLDRYSNDAGKFFRENGIQGPIFNDYDIGGYIIYHLFPTERVFVDNNGADSYPASFFEEIYMPALTSEEDWTKIQEKYGLNSIFISIRNGNPDVGSFLWRRLHDPSWSLVYIDTYAVILVKNIPANRNIIDKFYTPEHLNGKINQMLKSNDVTDRIVAGRFLYLFGRGDLSTSVLKKVVAQYPENSWVWLYMGSIKVWENNPASLISAIIFIENAVDMGENTSEVYTWLGLAYFRAGQFEKAEKALQNALWLQPGRHDATNYLNQLQKYLSPASS